MSIDLTADRYSQRNLIRCALYNGRRVAQKIYKGKPNWVLAMEIFVVGSTYAHEMCVLAGVPPEGKEFKLWE